MVEKNTVAVRAGDWVRIREFRGPYKYGNKSGKGLRADPVESVEAEFRDTQGTVEKITYCVNSGHYFFSLVGGGWYPLAEVVDHAPQVALWAMTQ